MNHVENALMITRKVNRRYEMSDDTAALTAMLEANVKATVAVAEQQRLANDLLREVVDHVTGANN